MRVDLEQLSTAAARIELGAKEGTAQFVQIAETSGLRGVLEQTPGRVEISDCSADVLAVREAQLRFGTVLLQMAANLVLKRMVTSVVSTEDVAMQLSSEQVQCGKLSIAAGTVTVSGEVLMRTCTLVQAERGSVVADYAEITNLALDLGAMRVRVPHVVIHEFKTGWGDPDGFWLSAKSVRALDLELGMANITSRASALVCEDVLVRDGGFYVGSAKADRLDVMSHFQANTGCSSSTTLVTRPASNSASW